VAVSIFIMAAALLYAKRNAVKSILFPLAYHAYASTPLGLLMHRRQLHEPRFKAAHSVADRLHDYGSFIVATVPFLSDNYAYLIVDVQTGYTAAVDPADEDKVMSAFASLTPSSQHWRNAGILSRVQSPPKLHTILTTHKHADHSGGNAALMEKFPELHVLIGENDTNCASTRKCRGGEVYHLGSTPITVLDTPCHTSGHVSYHVKAAEGAGAVFTGDTLFVGGVGKFFEGSAGEMYKSLYEVLCRLPPATAVFCGHEYTHSNLVFALSVEPGNVALQRKMEWVMEQRKDSHTTMPSSLEDEQAVNPFLRVTSPQIQKATGSSDPVTTLGRLREMKNNFRAPS